MTEVPSNESFCKSHHFHDDYVKICEHLHVNPLPGIKVKGSNKAILQFDADMIKYREWMPLLRALNQDKGLHYISIRMAKRVYNTGDESFSLPMTVLRCISSIFGLYLVLDNVITDKAAIAVTNRPVLLTAFMLTKFLGALESCIKNNHSLRCLALEGIPLKEQYLNILMEAMQNQDNSVQHLSLKSCNIGDSGCEQICKALAYIPHIITIDFSNCHLKEESGKYIARLLKIQKNLRYSENWKQTLRYRTSDLDEMPGLRRITLNGNVGMGNDGIKPITKCLFDDLWVKAVDAQWCGIDNVGAQYVISMLVENKTVEVVDLRNNPEIHPTTLRSVMEMLHRPNMSEPKCEWLKLQKFSSNGSMQQQPRPSTLSTRVASAAPPKKSVTTPDLTKPPKESRAKTASVMTLKRGKEISADSGLTASEMKKITRLNAKLTCRAAKAYQPTSGGGGPKPSSGPAIKRLQSQVLEKKPPLGMIYDGDMWIKVDVLNELSEVCDQVHQFIVKLKKWTGLTDQDLGIFEEPRDQEISPRNENPMERLVRKAQSVHVKFPIIERLMRYSKSEMVINSKENGDTVDVTGSFASNIIEKTMGDSQHVRSNFKSDQRNPTGNSKVSGLLRTVENLKILMDSHPASKCTINKESVVQDDLDQNLFVLNDLEKLLSFHTLKENPETVETERTLIAGKEDSYQERTNSPITPKRITRSPTRSSLLKSQSYSSIGASKTKQETEQIQSLEFVGLQSSTSSEDDYGEEDIYTNGRNADSYSSNDS